MLRIKYNFIKSINFKLIECKLIRSFWKELLLFQKKIRTLHECNTSHEFLKHSTTFLFTLHIFWRQYDIGYKIIQQQNFTFCRRCFSMTSSVNRTGRTVSTASGSCRAPVSSAARAYATNWWRCVADVA